jgi:GNAT superfamily N-acetyltransferase
LCTFGKELNMLSGVALSDLVSPQMSTGQSLPVVISPTAPADAETLAMLQRVVFPTLHPAEYLTAAQYLNHLRVFPEGQFVARLHGRAVGSTSTLRIHFDFHHLQHNFMDVCDNGWLNNHDPEGDWLYGIDVGVHPAFQRRGIGSKLYAERTRLVERLNLRGQITGGMLPGYPAHAHCMSALDYCLKVVRGELTDPTLSAQLKNGFRFVQVLPDYNKHVDGTLSPVALIVKENRVAVNH